MTQYTSSRCRPVRLLVCYRSNIFMVHDSCPSTMFRSSSLPFIYTCLPHYPEKNQISTFYLNNRDAQRELKVAWHGKLIAYSHKPVYLGATLDRCLTYKDHISKTRAKTGARNSILKKLANANCGTDATENYPYHSPGSVFLLC